MDERGKKNGESMISQKRDGGGKEDNWGLGHGPVRFHG